MTAQQIEDRTALALRRYKRLDADAARLILNEKAQVILPDASLLIFCEHSPPASCLPNILPFNINEITLI